MAMIQWFPVFISLLAVGRMSNVYRQAHNNQHVASYWWMGILATISISLYWYPPLFALIGWVWPGWLIVASHWLQDSTLIISSAIITEACMLIEYGADRQHRTGYPAVHLRVVRIVLVLVALGFVVALLLHEREDLYHYNTALNPILIGARYLAMLMVSADVIYLLRFNNLVLYLNPDPTTKLVTVWSAFALLCGLLSIASGAVTAFIRAGTPGEVPAIFLERGCVVGVVIGLSLMTLTVAPGIRPVTERLAIHVWNILTYLSLYPLWRFLTQRQPNVVLATTYGLPLGIVRPVVMSLIVKRQVREILDARRRLGIRAAPLTMAPLGTIPTSGDITVRSQQFLTNRQGEQALQALAVYEVRALLDGKPTVEIAYPAAYLDQIRYLRLVTRALLQKRSIHD